MKPLLSASLMLFLVAATGQQQRTTTANQINNTAEDFSPQAIAIMKIWETAYNDQKDSARAASLYSDDALVSSSGGSTQGRANIQQVFQRGIDSGEKITGMTVTRARCSGGVGFAAGAYTAIINGKPHPGHFVAGFENVSGKWLISAQAAVPLPARSQ